MDVDIDGENNRLRLERGEKERMTFALFEAMVGLPLDFSLYHLSIYPFVYLFMYLSIHVFIYLFMYLSPLSLSLSLYIYIYIYIYIFIKERVKKDKKIDAFFESFTFILQTSRDCFEANGIS